MLVADAFYRASATVSTDQICVTVYTKYIEQ